MIHMVVTRFVWRPVVYAQQQVVGKIDGYAHWAQIRAEEAAQNNAQQ